jgi:putative ABC transport system permease protein
MGAPAAASRLLPADLPRVGAIGLRTRRLRTALSALGIAIGIASIVGVLGISESSRADLLSQLDRLGTNLLTVAPGQGFLSGEDAELPEEARAMVARVPGVQQASATAVLDATVRRTDLIPEEETGGIAVMSAEPNLLETLGARMASGRFLDAATEGRPTVVLGSVAAKQLGIDSAASRPRVFLGDRWFTVIGVMAPVELNADLDRAALVGGPVAERLLGADGSASQISVRAEPDGVERVRDLLAATAKPAAPEEVEVSRPSDALEARAAAKTAFTSLFLGLGAVALLVGGVGIANVMVMSVLERRPEIGLRRALGATRRHVAAQFLTESLLLASAGGLAGVLLGAAATAVYAAGRGWEVVVPPAAVVGGFGAALAIGAIAGLYPASRAARLAPADALRST